MDDPAESDGELAARAQRGDRRAFDLLTLRYKGPLFRFVRRYAGNEDDAYDILQDTFVSAWLALKRYNPQKSFAVWLRAIAINKCRDHGRRRAVRRRFLQFMALWGAEPAMDDQTDDRMERETAEARRLKNLDAAIAGLPAFYKEPFLLTTVAGLSQQEAAAQLQTTAKAVEMRVRRARKKLQETCRPEKSAD